MKAEAYSERELEVAGWPVRLASYKLGDTYHCRADNVSPGATIARTTGSTRQGAEETALAKARQRLERTIRHPV
jgi:hypothetical protein